MATGRVSYAAADGAGVARLRLARAGAGNAIDPAWVEGFAAALDAASADRELGALLISAEGADFSRGGDLDHFAARLDRLDTELAAMIAPFHEALARLAELPVPVVCAAQGAIAGGGLGLLWCADVALVAEDATLATAFGRLGLSGDGGSSWWLPRLVGMARARELLVSGRVLSGAEAARWGLVARAVSRKQLEPEAEAAALELAAGPTGAYAKMRRLLAGSGSLGLREALDAELEACVRCGATRDAREGIAAFAERRQPRFERGHALG